MTMCKINIFFFTVPITTINNITYKCLLLTISLIYVILTGTSYVLLNNMYMLLNELNKYMFKQKNILCDVTILYLYVSYSWININRYVYCFVVFP